MKRAEELEVEVESLRERLSKLSEASLRINESLDFDTVLNQVVRQRLRPDGRQVWRHDPPR